jgi:TPR repeat protein
MMRLTGRSFLVATAMLATAATPDTQKRGNPASKASPDENRIKAGVLAWQSGNFAEAVADWRPLAEKGDPDAQFNLAQAYKLRRDVTADLRQAQDLYAKAAAQGHSQAQANLGVILFQNGDREKSMPYIVKAATAGDPRAQYIYGTALFNGDVVQKDWPRAYATDHEQGGSRRAAAGGREPRQDGRLYVQGQGPTGDRPGELRRRPEGGRRADGGDCCETIGRGRPWLVRPARRLFQSCGGERLDRGARQGRRAGRPDAELCPGRPNRPAAGGAADRPVCGHRPMRDCGARRPVLRARSPLTAQAAQSRRA